MAKNIKDLIGESLSPTSFFSKWLTHEDVSAPTDNPDKKHRKLVTTGLDEKFIIKKLSKYILKHHIDNDLVKELLEVKEDIYKKYGQDKYFDKFKTHIEGQVYLTGKDTAAEVGNFAEIILIEYVKSLKKYKYFVYKLRYNPNTLQSMKGDDLLMFNKQDLKADILMGESKFRTTPSKDAVEDILTGFSSGGKPKLPISITFVANIIRSKRPELAKKLSYLQVEMKTGKVPIVYAGFLLGDDNTSKQIENHHLFLDFKLTQNALDELNKHSYPTTHITSLLGKTFNTQTHLNKAIKKCLEEAMKNSHITEVKDWTKKKYKDILFEQCDKVTYPSIVMLSLGLDDPNKIAKKAFKKARKKLFSIKAKTPKIK